MMSQTQALPRLECQAFTELAVLVNGVPAQLGGPKQRLLLAVLLCRANTVVWTDELIEACWGGQPPDTVRKNLQAYVSRLRKVFGARLAHIHGGYRLSLEPEESQLLRFERSAREGRRLARTGEPEAAARLLDQALGEWSGPPLAEFGAVPAVAGFTEQLRETFLSCLEDWADLALDARLTGPVLARLEGQVRAHALRERLAAAWMRALSLAGRGNEALGHFDFVRQALARELGVSPGPVLTRLRDRLLCGGTTGAPAAAAGPGRRLGNQLPRDLPDFVGRAAEVHRVVGYLDGARRGVVVVSGAVGSGKSAFAVHCAHLLADRFPDGCLSVEVGTRPLAELLTDLLAVVGAAEAGDEAPCSTTAHAVARWRSWVATRKVLLVLDDAAADDVVRALLPGTGDSGAIVTSRSRLSGMEGVLHVELPPLGEAESVDLLGRIIGVGRVMADLDAARRLLSRCEGSTLAVRITGTRLTTLRHVRLADYADRLCRAACPLDEMAVGALTLRDRYDSLYRQLTLHQKRAYQSLVTLSPPFDHDRVIAALADSSDAAQLALESLVECNLLTVPEGEVSTRYAAYSMSSFAYAFGREHAARTGRAPARERPTPVAAAWNLLT